MDISDIVLNSSLIIGGYSGTYYCVDRIHQIIGETRWFDHKNEMVKVNPKAYQQKMEPEEDRSIKGTGYFAGALGGFVAMGIGFKGLLEPIIQHYF